MKSPKVFISYSHSPKGHREKVIEFAEELGKKNIKVSIDAYVEHQIVDWNEWSENEIRNSDYVLIICNEDYYNRYENIAPKGVGKGVKWEGYVIKNTIYNEEGNQKFIPIAFSEQDWDYRPQILTVSNSILLKNKDSLESLCRIIFRKPKYIPPEPTDFNPNVDLEPEKIEDFFSQNPKDHEKINSQKELIYLKTNCFGYEEFLFIQDNSILIKIPNGKFIFGNNINGQEYKVIDLPEYYIDKYAITNEQFEKFVTSNDSYVTEAEKKGSACIADFNKNWKKIRGKYWRDFYTNETKNHPVVMITPNDALAYCKWANKRLPLSSEWEKAARGNNGQIYPWGNDIKLEFPFANFGLMRRSTQPVDSYPHGASPYGCINMAGNVWEWCSDKKLSQNLRQTTTKSNYELKNKLAFVNKGGSWFDDEETLKCYLGDVDEPEAFFHLGFRCALSLDDE